MAKHIDAANLIRSAGRRVTNARLTVASVLQVSTGHMSAPAVVAAVEGASAHIDQSTVYRVLADLRDLGLVAESRFGSGETNYEWIAGSNHHHLHCSDCEGTFPLNGDLVIEFMGAVHTKHGFRADITHIVLTGMCEQCREKK